MCYLVSYPRNGKTKIVDGMWDETPLTNADMMSMEEMWMAIVAWMNMKMCGAYFPCCGKYSASAQWIEEYDSGYEASDEQDDDNDYSHSSNGSDEVMMKITMRMMIRMTMKMMTWRRNMMRKTTTQTQMKSHPTMDAINLRLSLQERGLAHLQLH